MVLPSGWSIDRLLSRADMLGELQSLRIGVLSAAVLAAELEARQTNTRTHSHT